MPIWVSYLHHSLKLFIVTAGILLTACASTPEGEAPNPDPLEGFNRVVFKFNDGLDWLLLKPAAKTYRFIAPTFVEDGVTNFFDNLREVPSVINSGLQGKGDKTMVHTGRFLVNSTQGVLGFIDVAKYLGMEKQDPEDFGQTLATWGVESGPYIVIPLLGPSTFRDGAAIPVNTYTNPITYVDHDETRLSLTVMDIIDARAGFLDAEDLISGDKYLFVRDAYLQRREYLIRDGEVEDSFGGQLDEEDF